MSSRIPLDHPCIFKDRLLESTGGPNKADSNYHAVVWRPIGGVTEEQIEMLHNQFFKDLGVVGNSRIAERGMFTIESSGRERHVHIALILTDRAETIQTSSRYKEILGEVALLKGCEINGVKIKKHVALKCVQPPTDKMKNYTQTSWLAYTAKEAALNPDFTLEDCNNGTTRRMKFVFDELKGNALIAAQTRFVTAVKTFWHKKLVKKKIIYFTEQSMNKLANEFYPIHCPELPWCPMNRAAVLTKMYLHKGRNLSYDFAANFFKEKYIKERFALHCHESNFPDQVQKAIQDTFDIVEDGTKLTGTKRKREKQAASDEKVLALQKALLYAIHRSDDDWLRKANNTHVGTSCWLETRQQINWNRVQVCDKWMKLMGTCIEGFNAGIKPCKPEITPEIPLEMIDTPEIKPAHRAAVNHGFRGWEPYSK